MNKEHKVLKIAVLVFLSGWILLPLTGCGVDKSIPKASVLSSGRITLSWNEIPGAAAYNIYMSTSPGVTRLNSYRIPFASTPITITDLEPGTTYYFMVSVLNDLGESRTSREISHRVTNAEGVVDFGDLLEKSGPDDKFLKSGAAAGAPSPAAKKVVKEPEPQPKVTQKDKDGAARTRDVTSDNKLSDFAAAGVASLPVAKKDEREPQTKVAEKTNQTVEGGAPETCNVPIAWDKVDEATSYNIYWSNKPYWKGKQKITKKKWIKLTNVKKKKIPKQRKNGLNAPM